MNFNKPIYVFLALVLEVFASCGGGSNPTPSNAKNITAFSFPQGTGVITDTSDTAGTIAVTVPFGTGVTGLVATYTTTGSSVAVGNTAQVSGATPNDFTTPVTYTVTATDKTTKAYVVKVTITPVAGDKVTFTAAGVSFKMAYVPGGLTFPIGTDDSSTAMVFHAYWIGETEVTYELWDKVRTWATTSGGYTFANNGADGSSGTGAVTEPVTIINWRDAMIWSNALTEWYNAKNGTSYTCAYYADASFTQPIRKSTNSSIITDSTPGSQDDPYVKTDATGFRMLTSNEWELAARYKNGSSWTPGNYASGATADYTNASATEQVTWYSDNSGGMTHVVGTALPNDLGLYDMSGNASEWSFDWYPEMAGSYRLIRGGDWSTNAFTLQVGCVYNGYDPYYAYDFLGFRLSRTDL